MIIKDNIPGFMSYLELKVLAEIASSLPKNPAPVIIEVGCFCGRSAGAFLENSTCTFYAIDPFDIVLREEDPLWEVISGDKEGCANKSIGDLFDHYTQQHSGRVIKIAAQSPLPSWDVFADVIFIDGNHSYEALLADILFWKKFLKPNGYLIGHDFDKAWPGVIRAVCELGNYEVFPDTSIWRLA